MIESKSVPNSIRSVTQRPVDELDTELIDTILSSHNQDVLYQGWVCLQDAESKALRDRLLVVSNFRLFAVKGSMADEDAVSMPQIVENFSLLELKEVFMNTDSCFTLYLRFGSSILIVLSPYCVSIMHAILFAYIGVTFGLPKTLQAMINVPLEFLDKFEVPIADEQTGLIAFYLAVSDFLECPSRAPIIDYFIASFQSANVELDLKTCLLYVNDPKPTLADLEALSTTLRSSACFQKLILQNLNLSDEVLEMLAKVFNYNGSITSLTIDNLKNTKSGIGPFAAAFSRGVHSLRSLSISRFSIGDSGIEILASSLERSKQPLRKLELVDIGITAKGFKELLKLLSNKRWARYIKVMDVSENKIGKGSGSQALAEWLQEATVLEGLGICQCEMDLDIILESIKDNNTLVSDSLQSLNLSGNIVTTQSMSILENILSKSSKMENLGFSRSGMKKQQFDQLFAVVKLQNENSKYALDLSWNEIGPQLGKMLLSGFSRPCETIASLILSQNELGAEGVVIICKSLKNFFPSLHSLALDCNCSSGIFSKTNEVGSALAELVRDLPSLKSLSISGDSNHYLKTGVIPLLNALEKNVTLLELNLQSNKFSDETFDALFSMIKRNKGLQTLDADNNGWRPVLLEKLRDSVSVNNFLTHKSIIPVNDVAVIYAASPKLKEEVSLLLNEIEIKLKENAEQQASGPQTEKRRRKRRNRTWVGNLELVESSRNVNTAIDQISLDIVEEKQEILESKPIQSDVDLIEDSETKIDGLLEQKLLISEEVLVRESIPLVPVPKNETEIRQISEHDDDLESRKSNSISRFAASRFEPRGDISFRRQSKGNSRNVSSNSRSPESEAVRSDGEVDTIHVNPVINRMRSAEDSANVRSDIRFRSKPAPSSTPLVYRAPDRLQRIVSGDDAFTANNFRLEELDDVSLYDYDVLKDKESSNLPAGVKSKYREMYLLEEDFRRLFKMSKGEFLALPRWKQVRKKRENGLF